MSAALSFEQEMDLRVRRVEANVGLCLNYVREIAKAHLAIERIRQLEEEYEAGL